MTKLPLALAQSAALGALTLLRPADWSPAVRRAYVAVPGAAVAVGTATVLRRGAQARPETPATSADGQRLVLPLRARTILVVAAGAVTCGAQAVSLVADARIEAWLSRHGVARPRVVMGAVVTAGSLAMDLAAKDSPTRKG